MNPPPEKRGRDFVWALGIGLLAVAALTLLNHPFLSSFAIRGDDYALVHHSARFFSPSLSDWIGNGYRGYNLTYPELGALSTNFIRPTVNATVYFDSWISPHPRSVLLLFSNYVGHGTCVALVFLVGRSIFGLSRWASLLASSLFLGSTAVGIIPQAVAYRGDMVAALFALISLLTLHSHLTIKPAAWKVLLVGASLLLALFAKESVVTAPLVLVIDALLIRMRPPGHETVTQEATSAPVMKVSWAPVVLALAVPTALYAVARLAAGLDGIYVSEGFPTRIFGIPRIVLEPLRFGLTAFFPVETDTLKDVVNGSLAGPFSVLALGRGIVAIAFSVVGWATIARLLVEPTERPGLWPLVAMGIAASAVPILRADPRIMYFSQSLLLPLYVYAFMRWWALEPSRGRLIAKGLVPMSVFLLLAVGPFYYFAQQVSLQPGLVSNGRATRELQDVTLDAISDPNVHRLYLVNASSSMSPGLNLLQFLAAVGMRPELHLRVVNTIGGAIPAGSGRGAVRFIDRGDELEGVISIGSSQELFGGLSRGDAQRLGEPGMIEYGPLTQFEVDRFGHWSYTGRQLSFLVPRVFREDFVIVGLDPGQEGIFILMPPSMRWTRVS